MFNRIPAMSSPRQSRSRALGKVFDVLLLILLMSCIVRLVLARGELK